MSNKSISLVFGIILFLGGLSLAITSNSNDIAGLIAVGISGAFLFNGLK